MSINEKALYEIKKLELEYEKTYGKKVDYTTVPFGLSQEKMVECLKLMISDNLSLVVAFSILYN